MKAHRQQANQGFAVIEMLLVVVALAVVAGTGWYVMHVRQNTNKLLTTTSSSSQTAKTSTGTAADIAQLTQNDASSEAAAYTSADSSILQNATSTSTTASNVGGAFNENNF